MVTILGGWKTLEQNVKIEAYLANSGGLGAPWRPGGAVPGGGGSPELKEHQKIQKL